MPINLIIFFLEYYVYNHNLKLQQNFTNENHYLPSFELTISKKSFSTIF